MLGPTELRDGERPISLGAAKQRGLLALLLVHAGRPVRVDSLVEHLWPDGGPDDPRQVIYSLVSRLRAVLGRHGVPATLIKEGNAYRLDVDPLMVDLHRFRMLVERARAALDGDRPGTAVSDLELAAGLWRGDAVLELRGASAEQLRRELGDEQVDARRLLADGRLRLGRYDAVLADLPELLREHPLDVTLARLWIGALCAAGREDDARRHLATFRKKYRREMRADPHIDIDRILAGRPGAATGRPHQLPAAVSGFVGREAPLAQLDRFAERILGRPDIVVITGMPGIGKTTLAVHWARRNLGKFPDGQLFLPAGAFGPGAPVDPKEALARFLHAFGVPPDRIPEGLDERRHRFNDLLDGRRVLVVLDNVASAEQARPLIPATGGSLVIITSRDRLSGLAIRDGVHHLVSDRLADAEARTLLARTIGEARAASEPAAVDRLAGLAGGLPLAVRIIGVRVSERPRARIADLADELRDRLLWEHGGQDSLDAIFSWSYRDLDRAAATMFRRLALHPGARISLPAAAAVAGAGLREAEGVLDLLARVNLVEHDTARRYQMHDLLRTYAQSRCDAEEKPEEIADRRLAVTTWFLCSAANAAAVLAPQLPPVPDLPDAPPGTLEFDSEAAARAWCENERANLGAATLEAARHGLHRLAWQLPAAIHETFSHTGRYDDLIHLNRIAAASARLDGHRFGEIANLNNLGHAYSATHQYGRAITELVKARDLAAAAGNLTAENICAHNIGVAFLHLGDTARAIETLEQVREAARKLGNSYGEAATLLRLGDAYRVEKQPERALEAYADALAIQESGNAIREQGLTHQRLSEFHLDAGDLAAAARHCAMALARHDRAQDTAGRCDALITRADIERAAGSGSAVAHARAAVAACAALDDSFRRVRSLAVLADALAATGTISAATRIRAGAIRTAAELSGPDAQTLRARLGSVP
ncbi:BTAD domain-containing putative transcriptional regulator [Actinoplanes sp. NBRC 103695]|uniref:AfsR/SARP family transcriptional regulator n=1 Tax=Actinoplanes sp. NBRC 103695 TaxID=3032202 RepID=UPI002554CB80|nr:BTAD domain-containing putative transcriptional regulator [Actinoplanes sp. NBRC 103695]